MKTKTNEETAAKALRWRCKVTLAGAGKIYGSCRHKRGRGAVVSLTETEAAAAESQGWITLQGVTEEPAAEPAEEPKA